MIIFRVFPQLSRSWLLLGQASEAARPDWSRQCPLDELPAPVLALTQPSPVEQGLLVSHHLTLARTPRLLPSFSAPPLLAPERRVCSSSRFLEHYSNSCLATPESQISSPSFPKIESP